MSEFNGRIGNFTTGNYIRLKWGVTGIPNGSNIVSAVFKVKASETAPDSQLILSKAITTVNVSGTGQITDSGSDGTGGLRFDITVADTNTLTAGTLYKYWVDVTLSTGEITTLEKGEIFATQGWSHQ